MFPNSIASLLCFILVRWKWYSDEVDSFSLTSRQATAEKESLVYVPIYQCIGHCKRHFSLAIISAINFWTVYSNTMLSTYDIFLTRVHFTNNIHRLNTRKPSKQYLLSTIENSRLHTFEFCARVPSTAHPECETDACSAVHILLFLHRVRHWIHSFSFVICIGEKNRRLILRSTPLSLPFRRIPVAAIHSRALIVSDRENFECIRLKIVPLQQRQRNVTSTREE